MAIFNREPVVILALVNALIALGIGFGLNVTGEQTALVMTFSSAVLAFIGRSQVTPVATLKDGTMVVDAALKVVPPDSIPD